MTKTGMREMAKKKKLIKVGDRTSKGHYISEKDLKKHVYGNWFKPTPLMPDEGPSPYGSGGNAGGGGNPFQQGGSRPVPGKGSPGKSGAHGGGNGKHWVPLPLWKKWKKTHH